MEIGGNDVHFADIVTQCVIEPSYLTHSIRLSEYFLMLWLNIGRTRKDIKDTYKAINDSDRTGPDTRIIVAGYPRLLGDFGQGAAISSLEAKIVNKNVSKFNKLIEEIVGECQREGMNIDFVDIATKFAGHEAYSSDPWINSIMFGSQAEDLDDGLIASAYSIHPNIYGAEAYAECVNEKIKYLEKQRD